MIAYNRLKVVEKQRQHKVKSGHLVRHLLNLRMTLMVHYNVR